MNASAPYYWPRPAPGAASTPTPVIELWGVGKRFGTVDALHEINLRVDAGDVVAFLGPNGAGKTTAIGIMLGLRPPTRGHVRILGSKPDSHAVRSRVGAMLQESGIPPTLKVSEVIDLFRSYYPVALPRDMILAAAGLATAGSKRVGSLSAGQRQRLYFGIAISGDPDLLFLDEPTTGMDVESRHHFWQQIRSFAANGKTILFSTHALEEADALASRIVVVDRGEIVASGTPSQLKARSPRTIRLRGPFSATEVRAWPGIRRVTSLGSALVLEVEDTTSAMRRIFADGRPVAEATIEEPGLESAFLHLTKVAEANS